ncbi:MAG: hypothetical protein H0W76_10535 [Pyrinomonadaceae bacterium]|nr:hypothetical protein [Pyrinomonadaceae bacterium]
MATPVKIAVTHITCEIETDEVGADEPYVLVTGINLKTPIPNVEVTRYGPWKDVDKGETHKTVPLQNLPPGVNPDQLPIFVWRKLCWGLNGKAAAINSPDDVILLVSLMEHDDGSPGAARELVKAAVVAGLAASIGTSRAERVPKLIRDTNDALKLPTGAPSFDERVGSTQELSLSQKLLDVNGCNKSKCLTFNGDGGRYKVCFEVSKG